MTKVKPIACKLCLGFGIFFVVLALLCLSMPFIAVLTKSYEGGEQAWGAFMLYFLLAMPASISIFIHNRLCDPERKRLGRIILAILFGSPIAAGVLAFLITPIQ
jgi:hypothetical protein